MKFCRIGQWVVNLAMITHVKVFDSRSINVWLAGTEPLRLDPPESEALLAALNATEIKVKAPSPN